MDTVKNIAYLCGVFALTTAVTTTAAFFVGKALNSIFEDQED